MKAKAATVDTIYPADAVPQLLCPQCERPLVYRRTFMSGVPQTERWDLFACRADGMFEYRHRTRSVRAVADKEQPMRGR